MINGRIMKGVGGLYTVATENGRYACGVRGIFRKQKLEPTVGDFVGIDEINEKDKTATISRFFERKNRLIRPRVSNVDQAVIVVAAKNPDMSLDLLDRFILLAEEQRLEILICINKTDLTSDWRRVKELYEQIGYAVEAVSCTESGNAAGADAAEILKPRLLGKVSVFAGPSGVGKSSVTNLLLAEMKMEVGALSEGIQRGKHTTRHAELFELAPNGFIVDSPGFTSLELNHIPRASLAGYFREFAPYLGKCRFNDCRHINEPDCAVKEKVGNEICKERYERYVKFFEELRS